jgi:aryl-phospho-beta-D-glucosidase BglC (GH1 family)
MFSTSTFYVREDLVDIAQAGLNTIRIPIGYWAVDLADYEPYVNGQYPYLIQAVQWAHELGMQVMISIHGAPGSQNGYEGSGLVGPILFPSNSSNIDRTLTVLKNLTTEFSNSEVYGNTVTSIELLNEPGVFTGLFTMSELQSFYTQGISTIRTADATMNASISGKSPTQPHKPEYVFTQIRRCLVRTSILENLHRKRRKQRRSRHTQLLRIHTQQRSRPRPNPRRHM